jgi:ribosomal protein S18 acetylase RimI-like enzyme
MIVEIKEEQVSVLSEYEKVPIAFQVSSRFLIEPIQNGPGGFQLVEEKLESSYIKDYDSIKGEKPSEWPQRYDLSNWGVLSAWADDKRVGGVVIAGKTEGLNMPVPGENSGVIWDLRVHCDFRRLRIGNKLFDRAADWMRERKLTRLIVETQDINVPACKFYARQGCELTSVNKHAYKDLNEIQLIWTKLI